jgi:hypothetical protein
MSGSEPSRGYLVECYWPGVDEEKLLVAAHRAQLAAIELARRGHSVGFRGSILVRNDETVFCLFEGEEEDVRALAVLADIPFERVLESLLVGSDEPSEKE